jgi:hypothetical protein
VSNLISISNDVRVANIITRWVPLVEQELLTISNSSWVLVGFVLLNICFLSTVLWIVIVFLYSLVFWPFNCLSFFNIYTPLVYLKFLIPVKIV